MARLQGKWFKFPNELSTGLIGRRRNKHVPHIVIAARSYVIDVKYVGHGIRSGAGAGG